MTQGRTEASLQRGHGEGAYKELLPELDALDEGELLELNADVQAVVATVLGSLPRVLSLRPVLEDVFRAFDFEQFTRLRKLAWCLRHTHTLYLGMSRVKECSPEVLSEGSALRRSLLEDARTLVRRGIVDEARLGNLVRRKGYRNLATDLDILVNVFRDNWERIEGKYAIPANEIRRAAELGELLVYAGSRRVKQPQAVARAADRRSRAFTLFIREYDDVRATVLYLRRKKGDGEEITPPLYIGRPRGSKAKASNDTALEHEPVKIEQLSAAATAVAGE